MKRTVETISEKITRITYIPENIGFCSDVDQFSLCHDEAFHLTQKAVIFTPKTVYGYEVDGEPVIKKKMTANGEVTYVENEKKTDCGEAFSVTLSFEIGDDELLLGLGQYEDGIFNYRNQIEYLYESNMRIAIPFLVTTGGYGILIDSESSMIFKSFGNSIEFSIDTANSLTYYVFRGNIPQIIKQYHMITGLPSLLPRWAFGYIQSKEHYNDSRELTDTVAEFRRRQIPIDCIVQDWFTWEEGLWGEKIFDKKRYPDLKETVSSLHGMNTHFMVSIWPNMNPDSKDYAEFANAGKLLPNSNVYDAFDEEARSIYWKQCENEIITSGTDALWCDNAEPFSDADWSGEFKKKESDRYLAVTDISKKSINWERLNTYGLYHAKGIYENWRQSIPDKRVVNLTRSGYSGCQKYGTILWSGDITATWNTLRKQITEAQKMSICGMPYWTLDIGGFFVVKDKYENRGCNDTSHTPLWFWQGDYNEGVNDLGYRELYVRWLQFGTFLPIFRSHGTDTPREPWQFGEAGDIFYDTITNYIKLRYKLLPYIYSLGAKAHFEGEMILKSLIFDFGDDPVCSLISDEYLFGDAFLAAPVYTPMYYGPESEVLEDIPKTRRVYLPKGCGWYDFYTNEYYEGGCWIDANAPLSQMPLYVREGSIIPTSVAITYADENNGETDTVYVYEGADAHFSLYCDSGDGYEYEEGNFSRIDLIYNESSHTLSTGKICGTFRDSQKGFQTLFIHKR